MSAALNIPFDNSGLLTVEDFEAMDLPDSCKWELIDGEVISVTFPDLDHIDIQHQLRALLESLLGRNAVVRTELPFAADRHNKNGADVGAVVPQRYRANRKRLDGAPELVIEVISRSNREKKLDKLQDRCFQHGCLQFWRVYPRQQKVTICRRDGDSLVTTEYFPGDLIPVNLFGIAGHISVNDIFE